MVCNDQCFNRIRDPKQTAKAQTQLSDKRCCRGDGDLPAFPSGADLLACEHEPEDQHRNPRVLFALAPQPDFRELCHNPDRSQLVHGVRKQPDLCVHEHGDQPSVAIRLSATSICSSGC